MAGTIQPTQPMIPDLNSVAWLPSHRLIASRFPTVGLYDQVADAADLDVVLSLIHISEPTRPY